MGGDILSQLMPPSGNGVSGLNGTSAIAGSGPLHGGLADAGIDDKTIQDIINGLPKGLPDADPSALEQRDDRFQHIAPGLMALILPFLVLVGVRIVRSSFKPVREVKGSLMHT